MATEANSETSTFDPFFVPEDWARLQYGRMLWKIPKAKRRLIDHWTDDRHPYKHRFETKYRFWVERLLESNPENNDKIDTERKRPTRSIFQSSQPMRTYMNVRTSTTFTPLPWPLALRFWLLLLPIDEAAIH